MICRYLRHIDLVAVYEQLDKFSKGRSGDGLANIPPALSQTLAMLLEQRADSSFEHLYNKPVDWRPINPAVVAAEVGDYIEADIEIFSEYSSRPFPTCSAGLSDADWLNEFQTAAAEIIYGVRPDYFLIQSLLVCLYDALCWLYSRGDFDNALWLLDSIMLANELLSSQTTKERRSDQHRKAAEVRHQETREQRRLAQEAWDSFGSQVSSMAAFARARHRDFGVTERTLYNWIRDHRKTTA